MWRDIGVICICAWCVFYVSNMEGIWKWCEVMLCYACDMSAMCLVWTLCSVIWFVICKQKLNNVMLVWYKCDVRDCVILVWWTVCGLDRILCDVTWKWCAVTLVWCEYGMVWSTWFVSRHIISIYRTNITSKTHPYQVTWLWHYITFVSGHVTLTSDSYHTHNTTYQTYIKSHQLHISSHSYHIISYQR